MVRLNGEWLKVAHRAPRPDLPARLDPLLADTCLAAVAGINRAWSSYTRAELVTELRQGADATPTFRIDDIIEEAIATAAAPYGVNILSEELGFLDRGSARTLVIDPLDGSANAAAGVPLSCFSGVVLHDGVPVEALTCWLETGHTIWASDTGAVDYRTTGATSLDGSAIGLLRPKDGVYGDTADAWMSLVRRAGRVRILSSSCLESMLVARGSIDAFADPGSDTHRIVDLAAAMMTVPPAGGAVIDAFGRPLEFDTDLTRRWSGIVAASPALADEIAAQIRAEVAAPVQPVETV